MLPLAPGVGKGTAPPPGTDLQQGTKRQSFDPLVAFGPRVPVRRTVGPRCRGAPRGCTAGIVLWSGMPRGYWQCHGVRSTAMRGTRIAYGCGVPGSDQAAALRAGRDRV